MVLAFFFNFNSRTKFVKKKSEFVDSVLGAWSYEQVISCLFSSLLVLWQPCQPTFWRVFFWWKINSCLNLFELVDSCFSLTQLLEDVQRVLSVKIDEEDTKTLEIISEDFKTLRKIWNKVRQRPAQETLSGRFSSGFFSRMFPGFFSRTFFQEFAGVFWNSLKFS